MIIGCSSEEVNFSELPLDDNQESFLWGMAESAVKDKLRAPSTADFPWYSEFKVRSEGDNVFTISSYVDAQNGFGAMIRSDFTVKIKVNDEYNHSHDGYGYTVQSVDIK